MKIVSIFRSVDGEVTDGGPLQWTVFVRLFGCNFRCYEKDGGCDTPQAITDNGNNVKEICISKIIQEVNRLGPARCTITGGEPLLQKDEVIDLAWKLGDYGFDVSLETNGSISLDKKEKTPFKSIIMDVKAPSTGVEWDYWYNLTRLRKNDYIKVVVETEEDMQWFSDNLNILKTHNFWRPSIALGPRVDAYNKPVGVGPIDILEFLEKNRLWDWRLNLQLHKIIWPGLNPWEER